MLTASTPPYPTKHTGPAIVLGSAASAAADYAAASAAYPGAELIVCNWMIRSFAEADHWVSAEPEFFDSGEARAIQTTAVKHAARNRRYAGDYPGADYVWSDVRPFGNTGLVAALIARWGLGFSPVILAGVPVDASGYHPGYEAGRLIDQTFARTVLQPVWTWAHRKGMLDGVLSMGGWTAELLGKA